MQGVSDADVWWVIALDTDDACGECACKFGRIFTFAYTLKTLDEVTEFTSSYLADYDALCCGLGVVVVVRKR